MPFVDSHLGAVLCAIAGRHTQTLRALHLPHCPAAAALLLPFSLFRAISGTHRWQGHGAAEGGGGAEGVGC